jgi:transcriptional regulator with XRE-family HTH domain
MPSDRTLAEKIDWLFEHAWPSGIDPARNHIDAAWAIQSRTGEEISSTTVWKLRTGRAENPQLRTLTALATFFDVPIGYFGGDDDSDLAADQITLRVLLTDPAVGAETLRALVGLPPATRELLAECIRAAARLEDRRVDLSR